MRMFSKGAVLILLSITMWVFTACRHGQSIARTLDKITISEDQRAAILAVWDSTSNENERDALRFLILNLPCHYSTTGEALDGYHEMFRELSTLGSDSIENILARHSDIKEGLTHLNKTYDSEGVSARYLWNETQKALKTYSQYPWSKGYSFEMFENYILPYRIKDEALSEWRDAILDSFRSEVDSLKVLNEKDPVIVANALMAKWNEKPFLWTGRFPNGPAVGGSTVFDKAGSCLEFAHGVVYLMRAVGIPSTVDYVPVRGDNNSPHFWPVILDHDGNTYVACTENPEFVPASEFKIITGKIYRQEFNVAEQTLNDVTSQYQNSECRDISVSELGIKSPSANLALGMALRDNWIPVQQIDMKSGTFPDFRIGMTVVLLQLDKKGTKVVSNPFVIEKNGCRELHPSGKTKRATLFTKFPLWPRVGDVVSRVVGGVLEGSSTPDFHNADTAFAITDFPKRKLNTRYIGHVSKPYRYYRYVGADSTFCDIAELELYGDNASKRLTGKAMVNPGHEGSDPQHSFTNVFDGDYMSSYHDSNPSGGWVGMDVGRPIKLTKIVYAPRNRDNFVKQGDQYELFCFRNNRWESLGRKSANSDSLDYDIPINSLLYLKNLSGGTDERIFEYDFDKMQQVFH